MKNRLYLFALIASLLSLAACAGQTPYVSQPPSAASVSPSAAAATQTVEAWPYVSPSPPPVQAMDPWQHAYLAFLQGVETYNYERLHRMGSFDVPPVFSLHDIDSDGIPELILISDDGTWEDLSCEVFTYTNGAVQSLGNIIWNWFGSIGAPTDLTEGLLSDDSYKGHFGEEYYYTLRDGVLTEQLVCEWNFSPDTDENAYIFFYDGDGLQCAIEGNIAYVESRCGGYNPFESVALEFHQIRENVVEVLVGFGS